MFTFLSRPPPEEYVYNLIESTVDDRSRGPPIYRSRYSCMVKQEAICNKTGCYKTMGVPQTCLCPPRNYLKKHSRAPISIKSSAPRIKITIKKPGCPCEATAPPKECCAGGTDADGQGNGDDECQAEPSPCSNPPPCCKSRVPRLCCNYQKPPVPCRCVEKICPGDPRNYIHSNVVKALRMPARKPIARFVFHPKGHVNPWDDSGYPRKYVYKDSFGCVPSYIQDIKEGLRREDQQAKYDMKFKERDINAQVRHLEPTEHQAILCGLKMNWEEKFAEFQRLPLQTDTTAKIMKKKQLEDELKALEKDIQVLERHDHVFVSDTCKSFYLA